MPVFLSKKQWPCIALATQGRYNVLMYYVYIIQSKKDNSYYKGITEDVEQRLNEHNSGSSKYSSSKKPYKLIWYCAFLSKEKALQFEKYLKHGSGHAFTKKHLI